MNLELEKIPFNEMKTIKVDPETLSILEKLTGLNDRHYDWWDLAQGIKNLAIGLKLLKNV